MRKKGFSVDEGKTMKEIAEGFRLEGTPRSVDRTGGGHIHETYLLCSETRRYILQKINQRIFPDVGALMGNFVLLTAHIRRKVTSRGGDAERECLSWVPALDGRPFLRSGGSAWRIFPFIENSVCHSAPDRPGILREAGAAFGEFLQDLSDFPVFSLSEILPGFHDSRARLRAFRESASRDSLGRKGIAEKDIAFAESRAPLADLFPSALGKGRIPLRATHNDAKLENVLFDSRTGKHLAVLDLDTVMPGTPCHDFGDSVRSGCNSAREDETDPDKVRFRMDRFRELAEGYLSRLRDVLTEAETGMLVSGALAITYEQGLRFLADYLDGDVYYRIVREGQNLDRARTQFQLLREMEKSRSEMEAFVRETAENR